MSENTSRKYGWKKDKPDHRDFKAVHRPTLCPPMIDLRVSKLFPEIWDQGQLGSCVAHATGAAYVYEMNKQKETSWMPSRLFIYYNARAAEDMVAEDNGCEIRDAMKQLAALGVCKEDMWSYNIERFASKPDDNCYAEAHNHLVMKYERVEQTEEGIEAAIASGYPVICGIQIFDAFESEMVAKTGYVPMPKQGERCLGGHAVLIVGYDRTKRMFTFRNSWGPHWGKIGHFLMPYDYVTNPGLADDFWTLQVVE